MKRIAALLASVSLLFYMLFAAIPIHAASINMIANPSVETAVSKQPASWSQSNTGTNTTSFAYQNDGHTGKKSLYVKTTRYTNGDAKWLFNTVTVTPGQQYTYSDYYQSNVSTEVVAQFSDSNGQQSLMTLATPAASSKNWANVSNTFTVPANIKTLTIYHHLNKVGWLQTDDFSLTAVNQSQPPTVSITAPADSSTVNGTVSLSADASDNSGIANVQFRVDGNNIGSPVSSSPYTLSWDSKTVANGSHILSAVATNLGGLTSTATENITVQNAVATPPSISISTPSNNSSVSDNQMITSSVHDALGIASVQYKLDGNNLGDPVTAMPYSFAWDTTVIPNGSHTLSAVVTNKSGLTATAANVTVNVQNAVTVPSSGDNLISNPSFDTADANGNPMNWSTGQWGTNDAVLSYTSNAHTGSKSATVSISNYTNGDAKWVSAPVNVTAGKMYQYNDWYIGSVTTHVVVAFIDGSGNYRYVALTDAPANTSWGQYSDNFMVPAGTVEVQMLHLLDAPGTLTIDDVSLTDYQQPTGVISNGSVEQSPDGNTPSGWITNSWGVNTPTFSYENDGHDGSKSVKTSISSYTSGDAKWYYKPITTLTPGKQYRWTTWYKSNTTPRAVAMFLMSDGSSKFFGMPNPFPAANSATTWTKYSETFLVPQGAVGVSTFLFISNTGWVQVDDQSLSDYQPVGWNRPLVTLTFDDGYEENVTNALPVLDQYGFKTTQCYETTDLIDNPTAGKNMVMSFFNDGHEICSHTVTHPFLTQMTTSQVDKELSDAQTYLQNMIGQPVVDFASPYGDYNESVNNEIMKYYSSHRTVDEGYNSKDNFNPYRLRVQNMTPDTTLAQYQSWLDQAKADNTWLILVYHRITDNAPEAFDTRIDPYKQQMAALNASGIQVETMRQALVEVQSQL